MQIADVKKLATLARLDISDTEAEELLHDLVATLAYVDQVTSAPLSENQAVVPQHRNVLREDLVTTTPGSYTEAMLREAPATQDGYIKVKKVL